MVNNNKREKKIDKIVVTLHLALLLVIPLVLHLELDLVAVAVVRLLDWEIPLVQAFKKRPVRLNERDLYYINSKMKE